MLWRVFDDEQLRRLFSGLTEQVFFSELGVCNPRLTDYLSALLLEFVHVDRIYRLRGVDGSTIREVSRMEAEGFLGQDVDHTTRVRTINRYIGDFTLFWAGVYPENLRARREGADRLSEYLLQGKRSYGIAGELSESGAEPPGEILLQLSQEFETCVHGLQLVRRGWERLAG